MTNDTKNPSSTAVIVAGWANPTYAYTLNTQYTTTYTDLAEQEYAGYGFTLTSGSAVNQVIVKIQAYSNAPTSEHLTAEVWDGTSWHTYAVPITTSPTLYNWDVSSYINTYDKVNNIKTRIKAATSGGCFPPAAQFLVFNKTQRELETLAGIKADWTEKSDFWNALFGNTKDVGGDLFKLISAEQLSVKDVLVFLQLIDAKTNLPVDSTEIDHKPCAKRVYLKVFQAQPTAIISHKGTFKLIHAYFPIPANLLQIYAQHALFKEMINVPDFIPAEGVIGDICMTDNHPLWVRNKGLIKMGELEVGDLLDEVVWHDGFWYTTVVPILRIDIEEFTGTVYDVQYPNTDHAIMRYLIGHLSKN